MFNKFIGIANLVNDIEVKKVGENVVGEFSVAINNGENKQPTFINCEVWNKQALNMQKYTHKGDMIAVEGSLKIENYEYEGTKRTKTYISCSRVIFLKTKKEKTVNDMFDKIQEPTNTTDAFQQMHDKIENGLPEEEVPW